nr:hypothetical protein [Tanacetum cinerariifolium]
MDYHISIQSTHLYTPPPPTPPTPPTLPTPPTPPPPPTPYYVLQIVPKHAPASTNDSLTESIHPMVTRSRVVTTRPNPRYACHVSTIPPLPRSYKEAFNDPNWRNAMFDDRYKARLVANGSTQVEGVDVDETFSSVVKPGTIWTLRLFICISLPVFGTLSIRIMFVYCSDLSMVLSRHLAWFQWSAAYVTTVGFTPSRCDSSLYIYKQDDTTFLLLCVDDIFLTASSDRLLQQIIASLNREFSMTDLGALNYFLGISVTHDSFGMFLSQRKYAMEILERAHMVSCNPSRTPVDTESKLGDDGTPVVDPTLYWSLTGSLQYLTFTRPDITYVVHQVCLYMHDPREPHFSALKRILRYVQGTLDYDLQLFSSPTDSLIAYSDANWAGFLTTRRSTSGYCVFLGNNLLSWSSKRQPTFSCSSAEAEYRGVANVVAEHVGSRIYFYGDIFNKGLPSALVDEFRDSLSVRCTPTPTAEEY